METCLINALTGQVESPLALPKSGSEKLATNTGRFGAGSRVCGIDPLGRGTRKIVCFETNSPTRRYRRLDRIGPSMRRPVSVKSVFLPVGSFRLSRAASVAILPSALFWERWFARCKLGVLISAGAAT